MTAAAGTSQRVPPAANAAPRQKSRGPIGALFALALGVLFSIVSSLFLGALFEIAGMYLLWPTEGVAHARVHAAEDLAYVGRFPRSLLVADTAGFARRLSDWARRPFDWIGVPALIERAARPDSRAARTAAGKGLRRGYVEVVRWIEVFYWVAQDTAIRLCVALFALPAFFLAVTVGLVDGLVRRDLRKWCGGRESSFVYHHSKNYTGWFMTGGFALYLAWPFRGFDPTVMVLVFTVLVAASLSITVASFKKYL